MLFQIHSSCARSWLMLLLHVGTGDSVLSMYHKTSLMQNARFWMLPIQVSYLYCKCTSNHANIHTYIYIYMWIKFMISLSKCICKIRNWCFVLYSSVCKSYVVFIIINYWLNVMYSHVSNLTNFSNCLVQKNSKLRKTVIVSDSMMYIINVMQVSMCNIFIKLQHSKFNVSYLIILEYIFELHFIFQLSLTSSQD